MKPLAYMAGNVDFLTSDEFARALSLLAPEATPAQLLAIYADQNPLGSPSQLTNALMASRLDAGQQHKDAFSELISEETALMTAFAESSRGHQGFRDAVLNWRLAIAKAVGRAIPEKKFQLDGETAKAFVMFEESGNDLMTLELALAIVKGRSVECTRLMGESQAAAAKALQQSILQTIVSRDRGNRGALTAAFAGAETPALKASRDKVRQAFALSLKNFSEGLGSLSKCSEYRTSASEIARDRDAAVSALRQ
jgi:hypothetical protein